METTDCDSEQAGGALGEITYIWRGRFNREDFSKYLRLSPEERRKRDEERRRQAEEEERRRKEEEERRRKEEEERKRQADEEERRRKEQEKRRRKEEEERRKQAEEEKRRKKEEMKRRRKEEEENERRRLQEKLTLMKTALTSQQMNIILKKMKSTKAVNSVEDALIRNQPTLVEKLDKLSEVLIQKPVSSYLPCLEIFKKGRPDLYLIIKGLEERDSSKRKLENEGEQSSESKKQRPQPNYRSQVVSDEDITDVVDTLTRENLKNLLGELFQGSDFDEIRESVKESIIKEKSVEMYDPKYEAILILQRWREMNGLGATRQQILDALNNLGLKHSAVILESKWASRYNTSSVGAQLLTDEDIADVIGKLRRTDLRRLLKQLFDGSDLDIMRQAVKENVIDETKEELKDTKVMAKVILEYWRETKGSDATRQEILDSLKQLGLKYKALEIEHMWKAKSYCEYVASNSIIPGNDSEVTRMDAKVSDCDITDIACKANLERDDLKHLFNELGMEGSAIENAEGRADTKDFQLQSIRVLKTWRQTNGEKGTRKAVVEALEECSLVEAKEILVDKWSHVS
ncbi:uncharacterized protein [Amphiura filiformis]|uniref:uncharacterized protein n=1 Tax=Amphiura filiformis TaxID=82378 RepID=UPI003B21CDE5